MAKWFPRHQKIKTVVSSTSSRTARLIIGDLVLDLGRCRVERGAAALHLGKLTYELLVALAEAAPNVLTHDRLVERVWKHRGATPETVAQRVKLLRQALGDVAAKPRYIELIRGQGYRLIPDVGHQKAAEDGEHAGEATVLAASLRAAEAGASTSRTAPGPAGRTRAAANDAPPASAPTFVGRTHELESLRAALGAAHAGNGSLVVLMGEAGIGKTRLAEELAALAEAMECCVRWGRSHESDGAPPYWPWLQALHSEIPAAGSGAADVPMPVEAEAHASPTHALGAVSPEAARFRFFAAVSARLRALAREAPLLLILEDLHWADRSTLLLLEFVAREVAGTRILVLATFREPEPSRRHAVLEALSGASFRTLPLAGLPRGDVQRLLEIGARAPTSSHLASVVHERTDGNPLFVLEIASWLGDDRELDSDAAGTIHIPDSVRAIMTRRLNELPATSRAVLRVASVIGREFPQDLLLAVCAGMADDELAGAIADAQRVHAIHATAGSRHYRFRHALVRETLYAELAPNERVRLHASIARALETYYGASAAQHAAELSHHVAQAERLLGPEKVVHFARIAGEQALAAHAFEEAARQFERALAARRNIPMDDDTAAIRFGLGCARASASLRWNRQLAWNHLRAVAEHYMRSGDVHRAVAAVTHPSITPESVTGMASVVRRILDLVPPDSVEASWLAARHGAAHFFETGDFDGAYRDLERAIAIAQQTGDTALELRTLAYAASISYFALRWPEALAKSRHAIALAREVADSFAESYAGYRASFALLFAGRTSEARREAGSTLATAERLRDRGLLGDALYPNVMLAQLQGDWSVARELSDRGLSSSPHHLPLLHARVLLEYELGDAERGRRFYRRLVEAEAHAGPYPLREALRIVVAAQVEQLADVRHPAPPPPAALSALPVPLALVEIGHALRVVRERNPVAAREVLRRLEPMPAGIIAPPIVTDRIRASLAAVAGSVDQAVALFERATAFCRVAGYRPELAWTCLDFGSVLLEHGVDRARAAVLVDEALELATALEMRPLARRAGELRARLTQAAGQLTRREIDVLRLIAAGKTNKEIGKALAISSRTVAVHVAHILEKTGTRNRTEAAHRARRLP